MPGLAMAVLATASFGGESLPAASKEKAPACTAGETVCRGLSAADVFALAERLALQGHAGEAETLLRGLTADPNVAYRSEARFRLAQLRIAAGDLSGAARLYRAILDEQPNASRVRIELAAVLTKLGDEAAARQQLNRAVAAGLPPDVLALVDKFRLALRSRRRLGGTIEFGLAPNSNINRSTADKTIHVGDLQLTLDQDARARSGTGATISSQLFWRPALNDQVDMLFTASEAGNFYRARRFDDVAVTGSGGLATTFGYGRLTASATISRRWFGGHSYSTGYGPTFSLLHPVGRRSQVQLDLSASRVSYTINPLQTGTQFIAVGAIEHAFSPRLYSRLLLHVDRHGARLPAYAGWTIGAEALGSRDIGKQTFYIRAELYRTLGDGPFIFPPVARNDRTSSIEGGVQFRSLLVFHLAPVVRLSHSENRSPVAFYRYRQNRVVLGLTRQF